MRIWSTWHLPFKSYCNFNTQKYRIKPGTSSADIWYILGDPHIHIIYMWQFEYTKVYRNNNEERQFSKKHKTVTMKKDGLVQNSRIKKRHSNNRILNKDNSLVHWRVKTQDIETMKIDSLVHWRIKKQHSNNKKKTV